LFTTIRELVENSLDAAESINALPNICVTVTEYNEEEHNSKHGIHRGELVTDDNILKSKSKETMYYEIQCIDNGCGINTDEIGNMLGRVLSGSKHGLRQTRGKFGLGAKMVM
jgi:DNA topoisomerase VI subunit B